MMAQTYVNDWLNFIRHLVYRITVAERLQPGPHLIIE